MQGKIECEELVVTKQVTVRSPAGGPDLTIGATEGGVGIWIGNRTFVSIQNIDGQIGLMLAGPKDKTGHAFAVSINPDTGEPALQLCRPGKECLILSGDKLEALFQQPTSEGG